MHFLTASVLTWRVHAQSRDAKHAAQVTKLATELEEANDDRSALRAEVCMAVVVSRASASDLDCRTLLRLARWRLAVIVCAPSLLVRVPSASDSPYYRSWPRSLPNDGPWLSARQWWRCSRRRALTTKPSSHEPWQTCVASAPHQPNTLVAAHHLSFVDAGASTRAARGVGTIPPQHGGGVGGPCHWIAASLAHRSHGHGSSDATSIRCVRFWRTVRLPSPWGARCRWDGRRNAA